MNTLKVSRVDLLKQMINIEILTKTSVYVNGPFGKTYVFSSSAKRDETGLNVEVEEKALDMNLSAFELSLAQMDGMNVNHPAYQSYYVSTVMSLARSLYQFYRYCKALDSPRATTVELEKAINLKAEHDLKLLLEAAIRLKVTTVVLIAAINMIILSTTSYEIFSNPIVQIEKKGDNYDSKRTGVKVDKLSAQYIKDAGRSGSRGNKGKSYNSGTKR